MKNSLQFFIIVVVGCMFANTIGETFRAIKSFDRTIADTIIEVRN